MSWTNEEKEKLIGLLLSKDESAVILALELMKQKQDVDVFGTVLYFINLLGGFDQLEIFNDIDFLLENYTDKAVIDLAKDSLKIVEELWSLEKKDFLAALEQYEKLAEVYESYLAIAPFYAVYYADIGKRLIGLRQKLRGYTYLKKATELMPNDAAVHFDAAYHYREAKKYSKQIIYHYEQCLALGKKSLAVYHNLGRAYGYLANEPHRAIEVLREGLKLHPTYADTWTELAYIQEDFDPDQAKEYLEEALRLEPESALANNNMAFLLWDKKQAYKEAKQYAQKAVKYGPYEGLYWHTLAEVEWYGFQNREAAIFALKKGKEVESKYKDGDQMLKDLEALS